MYIQKIRTITTVGILFLFFGSIIGPLGTATAANASTVTEQKESHQAPLSIYSLLIITPNIFKNELQPLVRHKNSHGLSTKTRDPPRGLSSDVLVRSGRC